MNKPLKLQVGRYYQDGRGVVFGPMTQNPLAASLYPFISGASSSFMEDGRYRVNYLDAKRDLVREVVIAEAPAPITHTVYVNLYRSRYGLVYVGGAGSSYLTSELALASAGTEAIACVKVEFEDGQYDD